MELSTLKTFTDVFPERDHKSPVIFVGHGSPMNGIEDNEFSQRWSKLGKDLPEPTAVLCISAHWLTHGTFVTAMDHPKTIHDFGGFPQALYEVQYPAPGLPALAQATQKLIQNTSVGLDHDWGLDHGCWTITRHMFPKANIPVLQLSIDFGRPAEFHYQLGMQLMELRKKNILIIGSGNMIHNLRMMSWDRINPPGYGYDWALELNNTFKTLISGQRHKELITWQNLGSAAKMAIPTPDHYFPMLYTLGLTDENDNIQFFNDKCVAGSLSMTSWITQ
jgi:4,5-DOPA dioxygenase extradiol